MINSAKSFKVLLESLVAPPRKNLANYPDIEPAMISFTETYVPTTWPRRPVNITLKLIVLLNMNNNKKILIF